MTLDSLMRACGNFLFRYRNAVFPLVLFILFVAFPPTWPGGNEAFSRWLDVAGIALALSGQALRAAVIGFAYIKRGGLKKQVYADSLVTGGFFGVCRNPLYIGNLLTLCGLFLVHGNPWAIAIGTAAFLFAYGSIVAAEEAFLRRKFGAEYDAYCRAVRRWRPDFGRLAQSTAGMRFNWRRVVIKDYGTLCSWLTATILLMIYEAAYRDGFAAAQARLPLYGTVLVLLGLATLAVRTAKKSGLLTEYSA